MAMIGRLRRYFFRQGFRPVPRRLISKYDIQEATEDERLMMLFGYARSPQDARRVVEKSPYSTAAEFIKNQPERRPNVRQRFINLVKRWDGHDTRDVYGTVNDPRLPVKYRYDWSSKGR